MSKNIDLKIRRRAKLLTMEFIKKLRGEGITVVRISKMFGVKGSSVYNWIREDSLALPKKEKFAQLAGICSCDGLHREVAMRAIEVARKRKLKGTVLDIMRYDGLITVSGNWSLQTKMVASGCFGGVLTSILQKELGSEDLPSDMGKGLSEKEVSALGISANTSWDTLLIKVSATTGK